MKAMFFHVKDNDNDFGINIATRYTDYHGLELIPSDNWTGVMRHHHLFEAEVSTLVKIMVLLYGC